MSSTTSSGTSFPADMKLWACTPSGVPRSRFSRNRSPVDTCGTDRSAARRAAWVPLPAPGGPMRINTVDMRSLLPRPAGAGGLHEAFVVAHHQLRVELVHQVHRD